MLQIRRCGFRDFYCKGNILKTFIAIMSFVVVASFASQADAGSYYSQSARQDREYKSLSAATQRAYGTTTTRSTYTAPTRSYNRR